jgi:hypothetical protein
LVGIGGVGLMIIVTIVEFCGNSWDIAAARGGKGCNMME